LGSVVRRRGSGESRTCLLAVCPSEAGPWWFNGHNPYYQQPMLRRVVFGTVVVGGILLAACSSASSSTGSGSTISSVSGPPLTSLLLTTSDLPPGWVPYEPAPAHEGHQTTCVPRHTTRYGATANFDQGGPIAPKLEEGIIRAADAGQQYAEAFQRLNACRTIVVSYPGLQVDYAVSPLSLPQVPGEVHGYVLSINSDSGPLDTGLVVMHKGPYDVTLTLKDDGPLDTGSLQSIANAALAKLPTST
jgi:hypothetical protein